MGATDVDGLTDTTYFSVTAAGHQRYGRDRSRDRVPGPSRPTNPNWFGSDSIHRHRDRRSRRGTNDPGSQYNPGQRRRSCGDQRVTSAFTGNEGDAVSGDHGCDRCRRSHRYGTYFSVTAAGHQRYGLRLIRRPGAWTFTPDRPQLVWHPTAFTVTVTDDLGGTTTQVVKHHPGKCGRSCYHHR